MNVQDDLVSVIIPCYNCERFISATIESVLAQSHSHLELIVVDDKSTDGSARIAAQYASRDPRVKVMVMERNFGAPAGPRNAGIRAAQGNWVALLDADDLWHPRKLELQMAALGSTGARMCSTQMRDFKSSDSISFAEPGNFKIRRINLRMQLVKYRTPTSSVVIERSWMLKHPFNEDLRWKAREDTDCFIRAHEYMDFSIKLEYPFVLYRLQDAQISGNKMKMVRRHLHMLRKYRLRSGKSLGVRAYFYTLTHFLIAIYYRVIKGAL